MNEPESLIDTGVLFLRSNLKHSVGFFCVFLCILISNVARVFDRESHGPGSGRIKQAQRKLKRPEEGSQKVKRVLRKMKLKQARRKPKVRRIRHIK